MGGVDGWAWVEKVEIKLNSTQVIVEVEVRVDLGNNCKTTNTKKKSRCKEKILTCNAVICLYSIVIART